MTVDDVLKAIKKYDGTDGYQYSNPLMSAYYERYLEEDMYPPCSYSEVKITMMRFPDEVEEIMKKNNLTL